MLFFLASEVENSIDWSGLEQLELTQVEPNQLWEFFKKSMPFLIQFGIQLIIAIAIFFLGVKAIQVLSKILSRFLEKTNVDIGATHFIGSIAKALLYLILILMIGGRFGLQATSVVALLGSVGLAIGLALQGSLSNFAAGIIILLMKPFKVGDYIIENNQKNEGKVVSIDVVYTKLVTIDNKLVVIPNAMLVSNTVTNASSQEKRRLDIKVGISYQSSIKEAKEVISEIIDHDSSCLSEEEIVVYVDQLADSAVILGCRFWVKTEDFLTAKWRIMEEIKEKFDEHNIQIPYSQLDIRIQSAIQDSALNAN